MIVRPHCPLCGVPCEDDGDRYYPDDCTNCGWVAPERAKQDALDRARLRRVREESDVHPR